MRYKLILQLTRNITRNERIPAMTSTPKFALAAAVASFLTLGAGGAAMADDATVTLTIKDHRFSPERLEVPANQKVTIVVSNQDASAEEFESKELKREKVIKGNSQAKILVGPLKPGEYKFFGEYHEDTAQGVLVAK
jgi:plastocyanin